MVVNKLKEVFGKNKETDEKCTGEMANRTMPKRDKWRRKIDFLVACVAAGVGLGNVWRFPYLCYQNGGGAFLIPYFISIFLLGIPMFILEVSMGQLTARGIIAVWNICPLFKGVGFAATIITFIGGCYYTMVIGWVVYYAFASFTTALPWTKCGQWWNTDECKLSVGNTSGNVSYTHTDPVVEYWERRVLGVSSGIEDVGSVQWDLILSLLFTWAIVFVCIVNGIKTSSKVMYFTATAPYLFLIILLIQSATLDGAGDGVYFYLYPRLDKLGEFKVWSDAGNQVFFSYALGVGALTALGSYNAFNHNSIRDCLIFAVVNTFTSFLAGFIIFATLGHMAHIYNMDVKNVAQSGPGLAFLAYPKALATMNAGPFWSVCFFIMLFLVGIDSKMVGTEGLLTAILDIIPQNIKVGRIRPIVVSAMVVLSCLIGLSMTTNGGIYVFHLFEFYSGSRILPLIGFFEAIVMGYFYGGKRFTKNMEKMYGYKLGRIPQLYTCVIIPLITFTLFTISVVTYKELSYSRPGLDEPYYFPGWSVACGWILGTSGLLLIPITMIVLLLRTPGSFMQRIRFLIKPQLSNDQIERINASYDEMDNLSGKIEDQSITFTDFTMDDYPKRSQFETDSGLTYMQEVSMGSENMDVHTTF